MKKLLLTTALFALSFIVISQNSGDIKGKIFDGKTRLTLPGASVYVKYGDKLIGSSTDISGYYTIKPLPPGVYNLTVTMLGMDTIIISGVKVDPGQTTFITDQFMKECAYGIPGAEIIEYTDPLIPLVPKHVLRGDDLANFAGKQSLPDIIGKMTSDVYVNENKELYFRGARNDNFVYYIDVVKVIGGQAQVPSGAIGSIMVYTGAVPAQYGDFTGGCVVIETMSYFDWLNSRK